MNQTPECNLPLDSRSWIQFFNDSPHPVLTWYQPERIELSGPVLARWLSKVINYRLDQFDEDPLTAQVNLPTVWQGLVWVVGLNLCTPGVYVGNPSSTFITPETDLLISSNPSLLQAAAETGIIALAQRTDPLNMQPVADLPPMVEDGAVELMSQPDQAMRHVYTSDTNEITAPSCEQSRALPGQGYAPAPIVVNRETPLAQVVRQVVAAWATDGYALVVDDALDLQQILRQERGSSHNL